MRSIFVVCVYVVNSAYFSVCKGIMQISDYSVLKR